MESSTTSSHDLEGIRARFRRGERLKFVFFWGHETNRPDAIGKECLSQWYPSAFTVDGVRFPTSEHFMMFHKAKLFGDDEAANGMLTASTPAAVKALGRGVRGFDDAVWQAQRSAIVTQGNLAKFSQSAELRRFLVETGPRVLVEASPVDRIWGIGMAADDAHAENPLEWRGLNLLGSALMDVRAKLL